MKALVEGGGDGDASRGCACLRQGEQALVHQKLQLRVESAWGRRSTRSVAFHEPHRSAGAGEDKGDAHSHEPGADHNDGPFRPDRLFRSG